MTGLVDFISWVNPNQILVDLDVVFLCTESTDVIQHTKSSMFEPCKAEKSFEGLVIA